MTFDPDLPVISTRADGRTKQMKFTQAIRAGGGER